MNNTENTFDHDPNDDFTQFYTSAQGTTLAPGEFLGEHRNYRLEKKLGEGGMAQVWLATEIEGGKELRKVVCKLLPRPVQTDSKSLEQIEKVFALTQGLNHPNICPIYGMKSDPTFGWFFVMGYADGLTLAEWFQEQSNAQNGLPLPKVLEILKPLASALDFAHKKGIIHRDVKPQNAMFTGEDQTLWLLDFGIASKIHSTMTATIGARASSGTPHFMAPEQCQGKFQDGRTDQYALATLAYLLLSGHTPFEGDSFTLWGQIVNQSPEPISKLSSAANAALLKALSKDRHARFATCGEFVRALGGNVVSVVPSAPLKTWFCAFPDGDRELSESELRREISERKIPRELLVWTEGMADWAIVSTLPAFQSHFRPEPPRKPVPPPKPAQVATALMAEELAKQRQTVLAPSGSAGVSIPEVREVVPGNVTLPFLFNPNPRKYEKFWERKGISGETALSPDGKLAVTCGSDIKILDFYTGEVLQTLNGHTCSAQSLSYSPDGRFLVSGSDDETVRIWNAETGACEKTLEGHMDCVESVSYSPDGRFIASGGGESDKTVRIWNALTGECVKTLEGHTNNVTSVSYSPDGRFLASGSGCFDGTVRIWNTQTGKFVQKLEGYTGSVNSVSYSPDGRFLASGGGKTVHIWNAQTGACIKMLEGHTNWVNSVSYSPDGRFLASGSGGYDDDADNTIRIWNAETGACVKILEGHTNNVEFISYSLDGRFLVSGSKDRTVRIWNAQTGTCVKTLEGHTESVYSVSYSPDGRFIASDCGGCKDNTIRIWNAQTGACVQTLEGHAYSAISVSYSPDGRFLASGNGDKTVRIWNVQTGACVKTLKGHANSVRSVSYSPDGRFLASGSGWFCSNVDNTVRIWNAETGECVQTLEWHTSWIASVSYSPDGCFLASGSVGYGDDADSTVRIWNAQTGTCVKKLWRHASGVHSISYSPDGRFLALGSEDGTVRIWDTQVSGIWNALTGGGMKTLQGHMGCVESVTYSPDGRFITSGSLDGTVCIWNTQTGECVQKLEGYTGSVNSVSYSPDGKYLSVGADDGLTVWRVEK